MAKSRKCGARCEATGKRRYRDKRESLLVLHSAQTARHWAEADGRATRRGEVRVYECPGCHGWHATSQAA
jgi:hypothetical protein